MKPKVHENLLRTGRLRELHGSSQAWSVLELVSSTVVTEKLEFACRTRGSVLAPGCCHLEEQAWDGTVQTLSSNASMHQEKLLTGRLILPCPCPSVVHGGVDPVARLSQEVTARCKICQQLAVTKTERGNTKIDRLPQKGGDETFPFRFPFR